jgi:peptide/nickel transport system permease protein
VATLPQVPATAPARPPTEEVDWNRTTRPNRHIVERLLANPGLLVGLVVLAGYGGVALVALLHFGANLGNLPFASELARPVNPAAPSPSHPFGVVWIVYLNPAGRISWYGFDLFDAVFRATPVDVTLLGGTIGGALLIGLTLGATAGYGSRGLEISIVNAAYILVGVPPFFLVLILFAGLGAFVNPDQLLPVLGIAFAAVLWPYYAIPVRARARQVATEPFVEAARAGGASRRRILVRHILPNSFSPVLAQVPIDVYNILFVLTVFPFLTCLNPYLFGTIVVLPNFPFPYPEWGYLLANGACNSNSNILLNYGYWWMYTFPALAILGLGLGVALVCDGMATFVRGARVER